MNEWLCQHSLAFYDLLSKFLSIFKNTHSQRLDLELLKFNLNNLFDNILEFIVADESLLFDP